MRGQSLNKHAATWIGSQIQKNSIAYHYLTNDFEQKPQRLADGSTRARYAEWYRISLE